MTQHRPKILIVEDNESERKLLNMLLHREYEIETADTGEAALAKILQDTFDAVILDLGLPGMDGYKFCANLKLIPSAENMAVIILTGRFDVEDKVMGFSLGACDFIVKPVDARELKARIQVHLKKKTKVAEEGLTIQVGPFHGDLRTQSISFHADGTNVDIQTSSLEFRLLHFFLTHVGHVISREQLLDQVWGNERHVNDRSVDVSISKLRPKLGPYGSYLQAVRGVGYRFLLPQDREQNSESTTPSSKRNVA